MGLLVRDRGGGGPGAAAGEPGASAPRRACASRCARATSCSASCSSSTRRRRSARRELAQAEEAANAAAQVLYRERRLRELERERERWLLTHLLGDDAADAEEAARALADEGFLDAGRVAVLVIRADAEPARCEIAVGAALDRLRRLVPPRGGLELRRGDHGVFVIALDDATAASPRDLAERLLSLADEAVRAEAIDVVTRVGIGGGAPAPRRAAVVPAGARRRRRRPARRALRARRRVGRARRLPDARAVPGRPRRRGAASGAGRAPARRRPRTAGRDARGVPGPRRRRQGDRRGAQPPPRHAVLPAPADRGDHGRAPEGRRGPPRPAPRPAARPAHALGAGARCTACSNAPR